MVNWIVYSNGFIFFFWYLDSDLIMDGKTLRLQIISRQKLDFTERDCDALTSDRRSSDKEIHDLRLNNSVKHFIGQRNNAIERLN